MDRGDVPVGPVCMVAFDTGNGAVVNGIALPLPVGPQDGVELNAAVPLEVEVGAVPVGPTAELEFVIG